MKGILKDFIDTKRSKGLGETTIKRRVREIERFFNYTEKSSGYITEKDVMEYLNKSETAGIYSDRLRCLNQFFEFLLDRDSILFNPVKNINRKPYRSIKHLGIFTEEEIKRLIESTAKTFMGRRRDSAVLKLLYSTGIRLSELVSLNISDIDFRNREIRIRKGKGDKERIVPVGDHALSELLKYLEYRLTIQGDNEALFLNRYKRRITWVAVIKMIMRRKGNAGIKTKGLTHAFRHSCASHMLENGAPISAIQRILGHERIGTTEIYTHIHREDLQRVHKRTHPKAQKEE